MVRVLGWVALAVAVLVVGALLWSAEKADRAEADAERARQCDAEQATLERYEERLPGAVEHQQQIVDDVCS